MMSRLAPLALALSLGLGSCDADRITSSEAGLVLDASITDTRIGSGETATLTYRLVNASGETRTLVSGDPCTLLLYVEDERGVIVHPAGGGWGCIQVVPPPVTLAPGGEIARADQVVGGSGHAFNGTRITLPRGRYTAYAEYKATVVESRERIELRSRDVEFEVD
jgi:hypothetical protein